jgi:hypothetical protein
MHHPVIIIAVLEIVACMRATALCARHGRSARLHGIGQQIAQLERLDEVAVPDERAVRDAQVGGERGFDAGEPSESDSCVRNTAVVDCMVRCMAARSEAVELSPDEDRMVFISLMEGRPIDGSVGWCAALGELCEAMWSAEARPCGGLVLVVNGGGWTAYEDDDIEEGVGAESVGTVDAHAGCFASGVQAVDDVVDAVLHVDYLAVIVCWDAAHAVVHRREHRDGLTRDVDAGEDRCCLGYAGKPLHDDVFGEM